jgi:hypothetical protein
MPMNERALDDWLMKQLKKGIEEREKNKRKLKEFDATGVG